MKLKNLSSRALDVGFGFAPDQPGEPPVSFSAQPAHVSLEPGESTRVELTVTATEDLAAGESGALVAVAEGARAVRVPWAVGLRPDGSGGLLGQVKLSHWEFEPSRSAPAVLAFRAGRIVSAGPARRSSRSACSTSSCGPMTGSAWASSRGCATCSPAATPSG